MYCTPSRLTYSSCLGGRALKRATRCSSRSWVHPLKSKWVKHVRGNKYFNKLESRYMAPSMLIFFRKGAMMPSLWNNVWSVDSRANGSLNSNNGALWGASTISRSSSSTENDCCAQNERTLEDGHLSSRKRRIGEGIIESKDKVVRSRARLSKISRRKWWETRLTEDKRSSTGKCENTVTRTQSGKSLRLRVISRVRKGEFSKLNFKIIRKKCCCYNKSK